MFNYRLKDLSRKLLYRCVFNFINSLYLIFHICIQTFNTIDVKKIGVTKQTCVGSISLPRNCCSTPLFLKNVILKLCHILV